LIDEATDQLDGIRIGAQSITHLRDFSRKLPRVPPVIARDLSIVEWSVRRDGENKTNAFGLVHERRRVTGEWNFVVAQHALSILALKRWPTWIQNREITGCRYANDCHVRAFVALEIRTNPLTGSVGEPIEPHRYIGGAKRSA
jgi:hypothetical protein